MATEILDIVSFLAHSKHHPILDVRSPGEFDHAHIPGAFSFPLFTNEERKVVGTAYKQQSREDAIKLGLDFFGPKMKKMVEAAESLVKANKKTPPVHEDKAPYRAPVILVHCWRGGMRSAAVGWLLDLYGFKVYVLKGGYKAYRKYVLETFELNYPIQILGGYTGSGKTALLQKMARLGEKVIDLEALAHHKGSAFGHLGNITPPSQEMFENRLALQLRTILEQRTEQLNIAAEYPNADSVPVNSFQIWMEDESWRIGQVLIPTPLYHQMRKAPCWFLEIPFEKRLKYICKDYGVADKQSLINATLRIQKRLGGLETKTAINYFIENNMEAAFEVLLRYYDKWYLKGLYSKEEGQRNVIRLTADSVNEADNVHSLLHHFQKSMTTTGQTL